MYKNEYCCYSPQLYRTVMKKVYLKIFLYKIFIIKRIIEEGSFYQILLIFNVRDMNN